MPDGILYGAALASSYVAGAVPFGLLVGYAAGRVDIRTLGSRNIGATNAARVLGRGRKTVGAAVFLLVFLLDAGKGAGPVLLWTAWAPEAPWAGPAAATGAIVGHMFSVFLGFRGGKGVAVGCGVMLALFPAATLAAAGVFAVILAAGRMVSVGSMCAALSLPVFLALVRGRVVFSSELPLFLFTCLIAGAVIAKHRSNIVRLLKGTEPRIGGAKTNHEKTEGT